MIRIKDKYELRAKCDELYPGNNWLSNEVLDSYGEPFDKMFLMDNTKEVADRDGRVHVCYVLAGVSFNAPASKPVDVDHYFDIDTLEYVGFKFYWDD